MKNPPQTADIEEKKTAAEPLAKIHFKILVDNGDLCRV